MQNLSARISWEYERNLSYWCKDLSKNVRGGWSQNTSIWRFNRLLQYKYIIWQGHIIHGSTENLSDRRLQKKWNRSAILVFSYDWKSTNTRGFIYWRKTTHLSPEMECLLLFIGFNDLTSVSYLGIFIRHQWGNQRVMNIFLCM